MEKHGIGFYNAKKNGKLEPIGGMNREKPILPYSASPTKESFFNKISKLKR